MISKEEIKKLADLARIEIQDTELESLRGEIDSILEYVGQIKSVSKKTEGIELGSSFNVMRDDTNPREPGTYTEALLKEVPAVQDGYVKVKKIL